MNKTLTIVGGGKGGVGKSMVSMSVIDYMLESGKNVHLIESDTSNPDVAKSYKKRIGVTTLDLIHDKSGFINLGNLIEKEEHDHIVLNTPALLTKSLITDGMILQDALANSGYTVFALWPVSRQRDTAELLLDFAESDFCQNENIFVLRNTYFGSPEKFVVLERFMKKTGLKVQVNDFPELNDAVAETIADKRLALDKPEGLTLTETSALNFFRRECRKMFDEIYGMEG